jgi:hypothetical protein
MSPKCVVYFQKFLKIFKILFFFDIFFGTPVKGKLNFEARARLYP